MPDPYIDIKELRLKVAYLGKSPRARGFAGHSSKTNLLLKVVGQRCTTTLDEINDKGRMRESYIRKLAQLCNFPIDEYTWSKGPAEEFENYYERDTDRKTDVPLEVDRSTRPEPLLNDLAVLEAQIGQTGPGEPVPIILELICGREMVEDSDRLTIKRGFYRLILGEARSPNKRTWLGADGAYLNEKKSYAIQAIPSDSAEPRWEVWTEEGYLGMVLPDEKHCDIEGLAHGDVIKAVFEVYPKDQCLMAESGENFSSVKKAFLQRILQKACFKTEDDLIPLCTHELRFREIKKPSQGEEDES